MAVTEKSFPARRFPPPWSVEEQSACFVVRDRRVDCDHRHLAMLRLAFLEAVDCHKRRPRQGSARYHHEKRYCS